MAKISKKSLGFFPLTLFLVVLFFISFYVFKNSFIKAQEQIKIFPTAFSGEWQNSHLVFSQDLSENTGFENFNKYNSAYPFAEVKAPEPEIIIPLKETPVLPEETPTSTEEILPLPEESGTSTLESATATEETANPIQEPTTTTTEEIIEATGTETSQESSTTSFWERIKNFFTGFNVLAEGETAQSSLTVSNFSLPKIEGTEIKLAQLRLSLAGKGKTGDRLLIEYYHQESWHALAEINLENEISNAKNNGFFLYGLPIFENWEDLANLKIKFTYSGSKQGVGEDGGQVYLDAVWLEVVREEIKEEPEVQQIQEEQPPESTKEERIVLRPVKKNWKLNEEPEFEFQELPQNDVGFLARISSFFGFNKKETSIVLIDPEGKTSSDGISVEGSRIKIIQRDKRTFKPGLYKLEVRMTEGGEEFVKQEDFLWGVLAINASKSIYLPQERAYLQMAALNNFGHTICDANLKLEIIFSDGSSAFPRVQKSGKCQDNNVTDVPDYFSYYQTSELGNYQMKLTNLDSGYEISDSFEVRDSVPFDIERIGPTRIYPLAMYEIKIRIKANQNFIGRIIERVPVSFEILNFNEPDNFQIQGSNDSNEKEIVWQVDLKTGETHELRYKFDAPNISPYLYLLGPLEFHN